MKLLITTLAVIFLIGCGPKSGSNSTNTPTKSLWSLWTNTDGSSLNLTDGYLGSDMTLSMIFSSGELCQFQLTAIGTEASGGYSFGSGVYISGGSGDPGCAGYTEVGTYNLSGNTLTICVDSTDCEVYQ